MLVDLTVKANTKIKAGDLLVATAKGEFEWVNQKELLRDANDKIRRLEQEVEHLKDFLKTYQENTTNLLKEVVKNG